MILGIDEAGRGCVIGPMVIAAAQIGPMEEYSLKQMGVKDSKLLEPKKREQLYLKIKQVCKIKKIIIEAEELDKMMEKYSLNEIEAIKIAKLMESFEDAKKAYIDSPDSVPANFAKRIRRYTKKEIEIVSENKADRNYPIVAAASIVAKVNRDAQIEMIKKEIGYDFNSGYTSDEKTIEFLKKHGDDENVQKYLRHKWATLKRLNQKKISDF